MSQRPELVSIILTTLESERYVARSIQSCLDQTHAELELIVVDGGSTDATLEIVAGFDDSRIRVIQQSDNVGKLPGAINLGMANSLGDYITWTQDDCWYETHAIETMVEFLRDHHHVALVYTDYWDVDADGAPLRYQSVSDPENILLEDVVRVSFLFRRDVYETIGPQDVRFYPVHDVPWRVRVAARYDIAPLRLPLMHYMTHEHSLTGRIGGWQLQRLMASALWEDGYLRWIDYWRRLAKVDIDQAFDAFVIRGDVAEFWYRAFRGVVMDPRWLSNRGLWKHALRSLAPGRTRYQESSHQRWLALDEVAQSEKIGDIRG